MSFADFADKAGLSDMTRKGVLMEVRQTDNFNYRTELQWRQFLQAYQMKARDRRRM